MSDSPVGTGPRCYRHPDRETYISCQRCGRPICPDCMTQASVGFHCPECVREWRSRSRAPRTVYGGRLASRSSAVTMTLIGINVGVFLIAAITGGGDGRFTQLLALTPDSSGLPDGWGIEGVAQGAYWQLLTSTFLHLGILHLGLNMFALWIFGPFMESQLGRWRYLSLYLVSGLAGSVTAYLFASGPTFPPVWQPTLGASGAIFGLFGATLLVLLKQKRDISQLLLLLGLNLVLTFTVPNISWQGHVGGLLAGLAMGAGFAYAPRRQRQLLGVLMVVAMLALLTVLTLAKTASLT